MSAVLANLANSPPLSPRLVVLLVQFAPRLVGWGAFGPDSIKGNLKFFEYEPKTWMEDDVDIKIMYCGIVSVLWQDVLFYGSPTCLVFPTSVTNSIPFRSSFQVRF